LCGSIKPPEWRGWTLPGRREFSSEFISEFIHLDMPGQLGARLFIWW